MRSEVDHRWGEWRREWKLRKKVGELSRDRSKREREGSNSLLLNSKVQLEEWGDLPR